VLGTTLYADSTPVFVMGIEGERQSLYRVVEGKDITASSAGGAAALAQRARVAPVGVVGDRTRASGPRVPVLLNRNAATALGVTVGDTLTLRTGASGAPMVFSPGLDVVVTGLIDIAFDLPEQRTAVLPLAALQRLRPEPADAASFVLVKLEGDDDGFAPAGHQRAAAAALSAALPDLSVYSIDTLMDALQRQLAYFKQFALILSTISLLVTFLLVAVVLTIGVGERRGEIAALRSMGFRRRSIQAMILSESAVLLAMGAIAGSGLGWLLAGYLDRILTQSPSLPEGYRFFIPAPREIVAAVLMSGAAGVAAALLPAVQAARVDIPKTLHEEVV
jgi:putative ABC transport system permease protein